jgi:aminoglycoside phosphotransferase (APT) family kinase protein
VPNVSEEWQRAFAWIEDALGGKIVRAERQPRWRPAWFLDLERDGAIVPLYFRGDRGEADHGVYGLEHEMRVLGVLEAHGIPVPHVHGLCPAPRGIVMERAPGRANLATAADDAERRAVLDHYMELLARMHAIDVGAFEAAGLAPPQSAEERSLLDFDRWVRAYRKRKQRPEPAIEYLIRWVHREVPRDRTRVSFVCADAGQFLFEAGRVTAVIDLELATLGDPAADLGGLRGRDLSEPLGDLRRGIATYERVAGEAVDRDAVDFHTVRFNAVTPMALAHLVAAPLHGTDFVQFRSWYAVWTRTALEVIAGRLGLALDAPPVEPPATAASGGDFAGYESDAAARLAVWRERDRSLGPALDAEGRADVARLLGRSFATRGEADAALEAFVANATASDDAALVALLHRRALRDERILAPLLRELAGARMQSIG